MGTFMMMKSAPKRKITSIFEFGAKRTQKWSSFLLCTVLLSRHVLGHNGKKADCANIFCDAAE